MRVADCVVGQLQVLEHVHLTAGPEAAIPVLVAGEILDDRLHGRAVRISGIGKGDMAAGPEMAVGLRAAVGHVAVKVRMGGVALELQHRGSTWPGIRTEVCACKRTCRMLRQREPEACR